MNTLTAVIFAAAGAAFGSFLNVCIDRLPAGSSIIRPPSFCDSCQRRIPRRELIPLLSFLWLRRRCSQCRALIPWRVFWVEAATGLSFALLYWHFGLTADLAVALFYFCLFIVIFVIDLDHRLILNRIVYPAAAAALIINVLMPQPVLEGLLGGGVGFAILLVPALIFRGGIGWGDVKMAGLIGLVVGFPQVLVAVVGGIIVGGLVAAFLLLLRLKGRKDAIPFGPFLSLTTMVTIVYGQELLDWYLGLFP